MNKNVNPRDILILSAKTHKGKNRLREHGDRWLVREVDHSVLSRNLGYLICPATYIGTEHLEPKYDRPSSVHQNDGYCRWVRKVNDEHFAIEEVVPNDLP